MKFSGPLFAGILAAIGLLAAPGPALAQAALATPPKVIIEDNDFAGPAGSDLQSTLPLLADPSLTMLGFEAYIDIDTVWGPDCGRAHLWSDATVPKGMGLRKVSLVRSIDAERFLDRFVKSNRIEPKP